MTQQDVVGVLITLIGTWLLYRSRKRVFDRKNAFGREVFASYLGKLVSRTVDLALTFFSMVVMLTGAILLALEHQQSWGGIVLLPVAWILLVGYFPSKRR